MNIVQNNAIFVGYSIKNRKFTSNFFKRVGKAAADASAFLLVAILDIPYAYNLSAFNSSLIPSPDDFNSCVKTGDERERMVNRALSSILGLKFEIRRWPSMEVDAVSFLRKEMEVAVASSQAFRTELIKNSAQWLGAKTPLDPSKFIQFQLMELPVLVDLFYNQLFLIDIYPGKPSEFFSDLEKGRWVRELPMASKIAVGKKLCAVDTSDMNFDEPLLLQLFEEA